jgi:D-sedoheptulose 7-phosphate isomerase
VRSPELLPLAGWRRGSEAGEFMTEGILRKNVESSIEVHRLVLEACLPAMQAAADALIAAYRNGRKAIFFGNGGSAADAQHLAAELVGRYLRERPALAALALHANASSVTAIANDYGYDQIFSRQVQALAVPGDVAIGISTSGHSKNVIEALIAARKMGVFTIGLTGATGGGMRDVVDVLIAVPSRETPRIQECHILVGHALCDAVEEAMVAGLAADETSAARHRS